MGMGAVCIRGRKGPWKLIKGVCESFAKSLRGNSFPVIALDLLGGSGGLSKWLNKRDN